MAFAISKKGVRFMRLDVKRRTMEIIPETDQDLAFIEEVLLLQEDGEETKTIRKDPSKIMGVLVLEIIPKGH